MTQFEFGVSRLEAMGNSRFVLDGRCYEIEIRLGDRFTGLREHLFRLSSTVIDVETEIWLEQKLPIVFRIERIEAYGKALDFLSPGMTGRLTVIAEGEWPCIGISLCGERQE